MPKFTLKTGEERPVTTGGLFLSIILASAEFTVRSPELGGDLIGETTRQFKLPGINQVWFVNESDSPIDIKYESSNVETFLSGKGAVTVSNEVVVKRIVEAIQVNANATVENGKMALLSSQAFVPIDNLTIPAGQSRKFASARAVAGRKVTIQVITNDIDLSTVRIGTTAAISANQGIYLQGNLSAVSGYEFSTEAAVYIFNSGIKDAVVTGAEQWR